MYGDAETKLAIYAETSARSAFIRRTYGYLAGAVLAFMTLEGYLLRWSGAEALIQNMVGGFSWLLVFGAFMAVSWLADRWARSEAAPHTQYLGLGLYVTAEAVIFLPLLYIAAYYSSPDVIPTAGIITALTFGSLTLTALTTERDFSLLGGLLQAGGFVARHDRGQHPVWLQPRPLLHPADDPLRRRRHPLQHVQRDVLLPHRPARSSVAGAVRLRSAAVLVRAAGEDELGVRRVMLGLTT